MIYSSKNLANRFLKYIRRLFYSARKCESVFLILTALGFKPEVFRSVLEINVNVLPRFTIVPPRVEIIFYRRFRRCSDQIRKEILPGDRSSFYEMVPLVEVRSRWVREG